LADERLRRRPAAADVGRAQVLALDPDLARLAIRCRIARKLAHAREQRVITRRDRLEVQWSSSSNEYLRRSPVGMRAGSGRPGTRPAAVIAPRAPARTCGDAPDTRRARAAPPGAARSRNPC